MKRQQWKICELASRRDVPNFLAFVLVHRYVNNIVAVCEVLLRSVVVSVHEFAATAYKQLFLNYDAHVQSVGSHR